MRRRSHFVVFLGDFETIVLALIFLAEGSRVIFLSISHTLFFSLGQILFLSVVSIYVFQIASILTLIVRIHEKDLLYIER